jgi:hypothetical protein
MGYNLRALLNECKKSTGNTHCEMVWKALIHVMAETLRTGKGCSVRNLLSITSIRTSIRDPKPGLKVSFVLLGVTLLWWGESTQPTQQQH